ncbi:MAG: hypothetical protein AB1942_21130 [Pseudomonadota bacterium]
MPGIIKATTQKTGAMGLATIVAAPGPGLVRRVDLTATNITAAGAMAAADVYINDTATPLNSGYRKKGYPVPPPPDPGCTVILEYGLFLTEGQELQIRAGAADSVAFSAEVVEGDNLDA